MTQDYKHPIAPPPELVEQWIKEADGGHDPRWQNYEQDIATCAAQWGADQANADIERKLQEAADQELEVCRQWLEINGAPCKFIDGLLAARRPKPPSLKEQGIKSLDNVINCIKSLVPGASVDGEDIKVLRRALESIPDPS